MGKIDYVVYGAAIFVLVACFVPLACLIRARRENGRLRELMRVEEQSRRNKIDWDRHMDVAKLRRAGLL